MTYENKHVVPSDSIGALLRSATRGHSGDLKVVLEVDCHRGPGGVTVSVVRGVVREKK